MSTLTVQENDMIENSEVRAKYLGKVEELEKIKKLTTLPNTEFLTTKAVSEYFEVSQEVIRDNIRRNRHELEDSGMKEYTYSEIKNLIGSEKISRPKIRELGINTARKTNIFTKRAVLNLGMLLRDSDIAKQLRSNILDVYEAAPKEIKLAPIETEQQLLLNIIYAEDKVDKATAISEFNQFKNQHINKLENVITEQKPKVKIHDQLVASVNLVDMIITAKNIGVGEKKLFEFLRATKILFKQGSDNIPYQQYQNEGYFEVKTTIRLDKYNREYRYYTTKVTGKGKVFIQNLIDKYGGSEVINNLKLNEIKDYVKNYKKELMNN